MDCEQAVYLISADMDGEIEAGDRAAFESHLSGCASCRETREALRRQDHDLRAAFTSRRQAAQALSERLLTRVPRPKPRVWGGLPWVPMLLSAAAGFLLAVVAFYRPEPTPAPAQPPIAKQAVPPPAQSGASPAPAPSGANQLTAPAIELAAPVLLGVATGAVEMQRSGAAGWEPVPSGGRIETGTRVRTGAGVRCEFRTADGSEVRLNGDTELLFAGRRKVELARGQVFSSVAEDREPYAVEVPSHRATITALGTQFDVELKPDETELTMVQGVTKVEDRGGRELGRFRVGEVAHIRDGRIDKKAAAYDLVLATSWINEILKLKGPDNAELARRRDHLFAQIGATKMEMLVEREIVSLGDHCVKPLSMYIQSDLSQRDRHKRIEAARILQKIAVPWAIPDLIDLLNDQEAEVRFWAATGLERLTKETQGLRPEGWRDLPAGARQEALAKWRSWWTAHRQEYSEPP